MRSALLNHFSSSTVYFLLLLLKKDNGSFLPSFQAMNEATPNPNPKHRLKDRVGNFLISHSTLVSIFCCTAGFIALLLLPVLAKNTYISENALMPGSANPAFSSQDIVEANKLVKKILTLKSVPGGRGREISGLLAEYMEYSGADVYYHKFYSQRNQFHPLHFFSETHSSSIQDNSTCDSIGVNSVGIIRAPRGDGKESIVLVTPYNAEELKLSEALSLGLAYSIFSLLSRVTWLSKDIVWLAADSRYGEYVSVSSWLRDYHNPIFFSGSSKSEVGACSSINGSLLEIFRRAGTMAAALVFKVVDEQDESDKDTLKICAEASNGQMPNLDLINIVNYLAVHRQGMRVKVGSIASLLNSTLLRFVGVLLLWLNEMAKSLYPDWKFGISVMDYVEGTATLASSMYFQALGVPTGSHGAFRDYQVDAITVEMSSRISLINEFGQSGFLLRSGRLIEGVIRSVNNLLEKFHQSFFLYFLTSPGKFVSVGVYMIAFGLLLAPLPVLAAALYTGTKTVDNTSVRSETSTVTYHEEYGFVVGSWRWLHAAKIVFIVHIWATTVSLLPSLIYQLPQSTSTMSMLTWILLSIFVLVLLYWILGSPYSNVATSAKPSPSRSPDWTILKAVMIASTSIGLGLMSIINFATAQIGALILVPTCLVVQPLRHICRKKKLRAIPQVLCNLFLGIIGFPLAMLLVLKSLSTEFSGISIGDFWVWAESLWVWNSATYLYLVLVHLPCWTLCIHIMLHPL